MKPRNTTLLYIGTLSLLGLFTALMFGYTHWFADVCIVLLWMTGTVCIFLNERRLSRKILHAADGIRDIMQEPNLSPRISSTPGALLNPIEHEINALLTTIKTMNRDWQDQANRDPLTGLPNRTFFYSFLNSHLMSDTINNRPFAVLFVDLDNFKEINNTWGHDIGDELLLAVASRLMEHVEQEEEGGIVSRLGGDEFTILLTEVMYKDDALLKGTRIQASLSAPYDIRGRLIFTSASIGVSLFPEDGGNPELLVKNADMAMFQSKAAGRNQVTAFTDELHAEVDRRISLIRQLDTAMDGGELTLEYQPIVCAKSLQANRIETLLRWKNPTWGPLFPAEFIPLAESTGAIVSIGYWVIKQACLDLRKLQSSGLPDLHVSINISAVQLKQELFTREILHILRETGIKPEQVEFEITESISMFQGRASLTLEQLLQSGVRISVDDFGTGYSSLSYLRKFPVHRIKVDPSFISDTVISKTIIDLGHNLGLKVVADGVETVEQLEEVRRLGCDEIQGYYIGKPADVDSMGQTLRSHLMLLDQSHS